jgi:hypothetical protein
MSHLPRTEVCQGNFAASVKEILPIHECAVLVVWGFSEHYSPKIAGIRDIGALTGPVCSA